MGLLQRTINRTRFYRPTLAKPTKGELMFAQESLDRSYRRNTEKDVSIFDFVASNTKHPIMTRRIAMQYMKRPEDFEPDFFHMGKFQITYNFSSAIRKNMFPTRGFLPGIKPVGEYGASGWSFRMLYEYLCVSYNCEVPFIDTYFDKVFSTRSVYARFLAIYDEIQDAINNEQFNMLQDVPLKADGTPDMRYAASKKFMDFAVWKDSSVKETCKKIAADIRHDIEVCLSTGRIPLQGDQTGRTVSRATKKRRRKFVGLNPNRLFYASGQLIEHLNVYIEIGDKAA